MHGGPGSVAIRVGDLLRYPVKSMQGESVAASAVGRRGLLGDRAFAVVDSDDGTVGSAKNPRKWGDLLHFGACYREEPVAGRELPALEITFPDGSVERSDDPEINAALSAILGRPVELISTVPENMSVELEFLDIEGAMPQNLVDSMAIGEQDGKVLGKSPVGQLGHGGFFDFAVLHLMTTSTLAWLGELDPASDFDVRRFRPNVVLETAEQGFAENHWVGKGLATAQVRLEVVMATQRCVMPTLPQRGMERDKGVMKTLVAHNRIETPPGRLPCAGVFAEVRQGGEIAVGEEFGISEIDLSWNPTVDSPDHWEVT